MKYDPDKCPECGEDPIGTVEEMLGLAQLQPNPDGGFDYAGYTEVWWDSQRSQTDDEGRVRLQCDNRHEWWAAKHEGES